MTRAALQVPPHEPIEGEERSSRARLLARAAWREHGAVILIVAAYVLGSRAAGRALGWYPPSLGVLGWLGSFLPPLAYAVVYLFVFRRRAERRGVNGVRAGWAAAWREARRRAFTDERLAGAAIVLGLFPVFASTWIAWKVSIPVVHPFHWDARLAAADRWLHGGIEPWRLTHAVLGAPLLTRLVDLLYLPAWGLEQSLALAVAAVAPYGALRRRYLLAYLLTWIVAGTLMASWFSSVGPTYLGRLAGSAADAAPFAPLMAKLHALHAALPLTSIRGQEFLLAIARGDGPRMAGGISAFPSMHVAAATLVALAARRVSRRLGRIAIGYALVIMVGSVHLGWHYAIDGYAGALVAVVTWWVVGLVVRDREAGAARARMARGD